MRKKTPKTRCTPPEMYSMIGSETHSDLIVRKHKKQIITKIFYPKSMPESQKTKPSPAEEKIAPCKRAEKDHKRQGTRDSKGIQTEIIPETGIPVKVPK